MNPLHTLLRASAVLLLIVLPLTLVLTNAGVPTGFVILAAVFVQCSAVVYLLVGRMPKRHD